MKRKKTKRVKIRLPEPDIIVTVVRRGKLEDCHVHGYSTCVIDRILNVRGIEVIYPT